MVGLAFDTVPADIDETPAAQEAPEMFAMRVASDKATAVSERVENSVILSADTIVTIDGSILGKPVSADDARRMLRMLSGRSHAVFTGVAILDQRSQELRVGLDRTDVWFYNLTDEMIDEYLKRENVLDKAGAYAIQGYASIFIPRIEGNYFNVMGLPLPLVYELLCHTLS